MRGSRALATVALGLAAVLTPAGPASADVAPPDGPAGHLRTQWAGDTVNVSWDGQPYATTTVSFVGLPVASPGDRARRTLSVTNTGPSAGTVRAWIVDVRLSDPGSASGLFDDVRLDWSGSSAAGESSLRALAAVDRTAVGEVPLAAGASTSLAIGFRFPVSSVAGNKADDGPLSASFDVLLVVDGDTPDTDRPDAGGLGVTGVGAGPTLVLAATLVAAGVLLLRARRGREARHEHSEHPG